MSKQKYLGCLAILLVTPVMAFATVTSWNIVPKDSTLTFTATQNDAPVTGNFTDFSGNINFDPNQLDQSNIKITVNVSSITDPYNQLSDTLKGADWFNAKTYPQAVFQSTKIVKTGDKTFQANGNLTIRDKTQPVTINFTQVEYTPTNAKMTGTTTIKRTAFGVGQGEWADTKTIKDDVQLNFTVSATKK